MSKNLDLFRELLQQEQNKILEEENKKFEEEKKHMIKKHIEKIHALRDDYKKFYKKYDEELYNHYKKKVTALKMHYMSNFSKIKTKLEKEEIKLKEKYKNAKVSNIILDNNNKDKTDEIFNEDNFYNFEDDFVQYGEKDLIEEEVEGKQEFTLC